MRRLPSALTAAVLAACGPSSLSETTDSSAEPYGISCASDPRALRYGDGVVAKGAASNFDVVLVSATPAPPLRGANVWTVKVLGKDGAAVPDATLSVYPYMPDHGHGTSVQATIIAHGDGTFQVGVTDVPGQAPLLLFMPGLWTLTFSVSAGGKRDTAVLAFCIAG